MNLDRELLTAVTLARKAGEVLQRHQNGPIEARYKTGGELVTVADLEADSIIQAGIKAAFPEDAIFSEEGENSPARFSSPRVWIIDPLDSTSNFAAGGDEHCVSIGIALEGRAVLGVMYNPARDELFAGYLGRGVTLNDTPVHVTDASDIKGCRISVSRKEWHKKPDAMKLWPVIPIASMAYKLARVAAGLENATFSLKRRKEWGTCAGAALVAAAGGRATLFDGSDLRFNRPEVKQPLGLIAGGPHLHGILLGALGSCPADKEVISANELV